MLVAQQIVSSLTIVPTAVGVMKGINDDRSEHAVVHIIQMQGYYLRYFSISSSLLLPSRLRVKPLAEPVLVIKYSIFSKPQVDSTARLDQNRAEDRFNPDNERSLGQPDERLHIPVQPTLAKVDHRLFMRLVFSTTCAHP